MDSVPGCQHDGGGRYLTEDGQRDEKDLPFSPGQMDAVKIGVRLR